MRRLATICLVGFLSIWAFNQGTGNREQGTAEGAQPARPAPPPAAANPSSLDNPPAADSQGTGNREQGTAYETQPARPAPPPAAVPGQLPPERRGPLRPEPSPVTVRPIQSVFVIPPGLSMPAPELFELLGYGTLPCGPGGGMAGCIPLTPQTSFDIAYKCYVRGLYADALVFAHHGLTMCNDARLYLLEGVCELWLGRCADAERTATNFRKALDDRQLFGMEVAQERINDPMRPRFEDIVEYQSTGH
jgi:hypothetical protein